MLKILYIDNNEDYRIKFTNTLLAKGYAVDAVTNPIIGMEKLSQALYDIVISEIEFDCFSGFRFLQSVKKVSPHTKNVILTNNDSPDFEIQALKEDIQIYLLKSRGKELAVNSIDLLKTMIIENDTSNNYLEGKICGITINLLNNVVKVKGEIVHLTPIEYEILKMLLKSKGKYLTRKQIIKQVWNKSNKSERVVDTHIKKIREKTKCLSIITVRGYGYMWRD